MTAFVFYAVLFTTRTSNALPLEDAEIEEHPNHFRRDVSNPRFISMLSIVSLTTTIPII